MKIALIDEDGFFQVLADDVDVNYLEMEDEDWDSLGEEVAAVVRGFVERRNNMAEARRREGR